MEQNKNVLLSAEVLIVQDLIDSSSESDDEDVKIIQRSINIRRHVPRIQNYVEEIVAAFTEEEFKAHFRYYLPIFLLLELKN